ncbi:MAG: hypothetical protein QOD59_3189 [Mycobacterium sp.]|nr:hypothetical protein [Mycobacterium sp.]
MAGRQGGQSPAIGTSPRPEYDVQRGKVGGVRHLRGHVNRLKRLRCVAEGDADSGGDGDDSGGVRSIGDQRPAKAHLGASAQRAAGHPDLDDVAGVVKNVQSIGDGCGDHLAVAPTAGFGCGDRQRRCHDPACAVPHVTAKSHGFGIHRLVERPAEVPVGDQATGTHHLPQTIPVLLDRPLANVSYHSAMPPPGLQ